MTNAVTVVNPSFEVSTAAEARLWCRIDSTVEDAVLTKVILAARERAEFLTGRALLLQTLEMAIDEFPSDGIELPKTMSNLGAAPAIVSVTYFDSSGVTQTMQSTDYFLDSRQSPCWLVPAYGNEWPTAREEANAVIVRYTAGFSQATIPADLWTFVMAYVASWYSKRELDSEKSNSHTEIGTGLLERLKTWSL